MNSSVKRGNPFEYKSNRIFLISITFIFLCILLISVVLTLNFLKSNESNLELSVHVYNDDTDSTYDYLTDVTVASSANSELVETLRTGFLNGEAKIDISSFGLTTSSADVSVLQASFGELKYLDADLFYLEDSYSISTSGGYIKSVIPTYDSDLIDLKSDFENRINEIINLIPDGFSDFEKALFLHDYIVENYEYDQSLQNHNPYLMMTTGIGVCQAYTALYGELLTRCGINVTYVMNNSINHIWNGIEIEGNYYHVDVTWDDAVGKLDGKVGHTFFLLSDDGMLSAETSHGSSWVSSEKYTDTSFDDASFKNVYSSYKYLNNKWYAIDNSKYLISYDCSFTTPSQVLLIYNSTWKKYNSNSYYTGVFSGLGLYDGLLYYNTPNAIYSYNVSSDSKTIIFSYSGTGYLYGSSLVNGNLNYTIATQADTNYLIGKNSIQLASSDTTWQNSYDYKLDKTFFTITLSRYRGSDTELYVPSSAVINGISYATVLAAASGDTGGIWYSKRANITSIEIDQNVILPSDMSYAFYSLTYLSTLKVSGLDTSMIENLTATFQYCSALTELDLSTWDLSGLQYSSSTAFMGTTVLDILKAPLHIPSGCTINLSFSDYAIYDSNNESAPYGKTNYSSLPELLESSVVLKRDKREVPSLTLSPETFTYTSKAIKFSKAVTNSDATVVYHFYADASCEDEMDYVPVNVGTYYLIAEVKETANFKSNMTSAKLITVNPATVTISVPNYSKNVGDNDPDFAATIIGVLGSDNLHVTLIRENGEKAGVYQITAQYDANSNYQVTVKSGKLTINSIDLTSGTVTLDSISFVYDGTAHEPDVVLLLNSKTLKRDTDYIVTYENNVSAGVGTVLVSGIGNYSGSISKLFTIRKATVTITVNSSEKALGDDDPVFTGTIEGLLSIDTLEVSYEREDGESLGTYRIYPVYTPDSNYSYTVKNGVLSIHKAAAVNISDGIITLSQISFTYSGSENKPYVNLKLNGADLIENIDYEVSFSDTVHAGLVTVTVTGIENYQGTLTATYAIEPANLTIEINSYSKIFGSKDPEFEAVISGLSESDEIPDIIYAREDGENVGIYSISAVVSSSSDYSVTVKDGLLTIEKATLFINTDSSSKAYDGTALTAEGSLDGLMSTDSATLTFTGSQIEIGNSLNTYELIWNIGSPDNYNIVESLGILTVFAPETGNESETEPSSKETAPLETETISQETETGSSGRNWGNAETESEKETEGAKETTATKESETKQTAADYIKRSMSGCSTVIHPTFIVLILIISAGFIFILRKDINKY